jgi:hypothetical protein
VVGAIPGLRGRLVSSSFARDFLPDLDGYERIPSAPARTIEAIVKRSASTAGPASSVRALADSVVLPLLQALGFVTARRIDGGGRCLLEIMPATAAGAGDDHRIVVLIVGYGEPLSSTWRDAVRNGVAVDAPWSVCSNGTTLRIVDARRTWSRDYLEFDIAAVGASHAAQCALWSLARADALRSGALLDRAVALSARHGFDVCRALGDGVLEALQSVMAALAPKVRRRYEPHVLFEHSLTVLYRILFLLFAEARGLVPIWHPIYRDRYSLDVIVGAVLEGRPQRGLWKALQAIAHLAHAGCAAGELSVTAFNGRLFAPAQAAAFDRARVDDSILAGALVAVGTASIGKRRRRIAYRDLDVEQLGAVYERVLDYQSVADNRSVALVRSGDARKTTGTFYTPRAVTSFLVRQALEPLVEGRSAEAILNLRVLDPAMGSGAFLVAVCRYLATAAEQALIAEGTWHPHDVSTSDRVLLRRQIAARCLFGVDLNPMAVQLARLSLWLAALSADKPLTFLDHHLMSGNSLVGATPDDVRRQPPGGGRTRRRDPLPLFDDQTLATSLAGSAAVRRDLTREGDDSATIVRNKERRLADLTSRSGPLGRWARALDLWCAGWFWEHRPPLDARLSGELLNHVLERGSPHLPDRLAAPLLAHADEIAERQRFLHWPLAFPEVFCSDEGTVLPDAGFDAVVGNPPWDMLRGDGGPEDVRAQRRIDARSLSNFVRESGVYKVEGRAHANRYQLFVERALQLVRPQGRVGLVLPSGMASDAGSAPLRRFLFDRADVDQLTGLDNRDGIFPIHRGLRFVLMTCTAGRPTSTIRCRFGVSRVDELEQPDPGDRTVSLTRAFVTRLSGSEDLGVPDLRSERDLRLVERLSATFPGLSSPTGWNARFGRELNASDDRGSFEPRHLASRARPVVEGKQIEPFRVLLDRASQQLKPGVRDRVSRRARLAYRDVASATNRLTLIAAIIPARAVTTHTLFCLKTPLSLESQMVLCGLLNSYVANYLIRLRVNTHVTASLISRLPVPCVTRDDRLFGRIVALVRELIDGENPAEETETYAELQALVATLYALSVTELEHVLSTFPIVLEDVRSRVLAHFTRIPKTFA